MPGIKIKELLKKYLEGKLTPEQEKMVDEWYDSLSSSTEELHFSEEERNALKEYYWSSLKRKIRRTRSGRLIHWPGAIAVAAAVSAMVVLSIIYLQPSTTDSASRIAKPAISLHEITNDSPSPRDVDLPDGSHVRLSAGSSLQYRDAFNVRDRRIALSGAAFFEISHNPAKPFYVFANEVVTKVLGTCFSVEAYPDDSNITVSVRSGKVSVYTHADKDSVVPESPNIILTPNQKAVYSRSDKKVSRMLVKEPAIVIPEEEVKKIRFEGAAASEIFKALERMYGVQIDFDEKKFSTCFLTTSVKGDDLYERIDVICEIIGAAYSVDGTTIIISGAGCN